MEDRSQYERPTFYNKRGVIAEQYSHLQAVHLLVKAREGYPLPKASHESMIRALFQAAEIALLNLNDLLIRAISDTRAQRFGSLVIKLSWARSFHAILIHLSSLPQKLGLVPESGVNGGELSIFDSPAFRMYFNALKDFDEQMISSIDNGNMPLADLISHHSLDDNKMHIMHLIRLCNHETTIWENNLRNVFVAVPVSDYTEFVASQSMYDAVYDTMLEGDTYYTQFRGVHQIPEVLTAEINDHIEIAIVCLRTKALRHAYEHLQCLNILSEGVLASLAPIADNLATRDYHAIRENLGLTSGSHSVNIHYHLFKDLYEQLWGEFTRLLVSEYADPQKSDTVQELLREIDLKRFDNDQAFILHLLANELLKLRAFINEWRDLHLHFPRNTIGGDHTKSLTGSSDAVQAVKKMRDAARLRDPLRPLTRVRKLDNPANNFQPLSLTAYFMTEHALDQKILTTTGWITKERFNDVQRRMGVFASKSPFIPPPKREV